MEKRLIAQRFRKAIPSYEASAHVQRDIVEQMCALLTPYLSMPVATIAEFGCGTGFYSRLLHDRFSPAHLYLNDLCGEVASLYADWKNPEVTFCAGDAEQWNLPRQSSLITGCSVAQWFVDPGAFFSRCYEALSPGGILAFSSFGPATFREIRTLTGGGLTYRTLAEYKELLATSQSTLLYAGETLDTPTFSTPKAVLRHLQQTGVTGTGRFTWTPTRLNEFMQRYSTEFSVEGGVSLTYQPLYLIAQKNE